MRKLLTVGCEIPGGYGGYVEFSSKASLLDADFVLFYPELGSLRYSPHEHQGKTLLSDASSARLKEILAHWHKELSDTLKVGKTVFIVLSAPQEVYISTGEKQYSGTGRNLTTINLVDIRSSYHMLPQLLTKIVESVGTSMNLVPDASILREYWQQFGEESQYHVYMEDTKSFSPLVTTPDGSRVVGGMVSVKRGGTLIALPWIDLKREEDFIEEYENNEGEFKYKWTSKANKWGKKFLDSLEEIDETLRSQTTVTPPPIWTQSDEFRTRQESELAEKLLQIQTEISGLENKRDSINSELDNAGSLKRLLFAQGLELENAVIDALELLGFSAERYAKGSSEFDVVLECPEGRCLGEVEGRDSKAISIDKIRQLVTNIIEDFERDEVSSKAKGILFGNAFRLKKPTDRPTEHFTSKCVKVAKMSEIALIRTCDLFEVAKTLSDTPNPDFAASCRQVILNTSGREVEFPSIHDSDVMAKINHDKSGTS